MALARVVVASQDRLGPAMAGPAIRSFEFARALAREHDVTLITPHRVEITGDGFAVREYHSSAELKVAIADCDIIIAFGSLLRDHPLVARSDKIIIADLYDPALFEALVLSAEQPLTQRIRVHRDALAALRSQLIRADVVLCASEPQRDLTFGMLTSLGRVDPATYGEDPTLRQLVRIVPFGLSPAPEPASRPGPLRDRLQLGPDDLLVLWGGGIYEWLDPILLVEAIAHLENPRVKAFFMGMSHPTPEVPLMPIVARTVERAADLGVKDERVFFGEGWVEYSERAAYLLDADVGVSLHRDHIEATFAFRTRLLDYIWAGLPIVCSDGDVFARLVKSRDLGEVVPVGDVDALRNALERLSDPTRRKRHSANLRSVADEMRWDKMVEPVMEFCRSPARAADRLGPYRKLRKRVERADRLHTVLRTIAGPSLRGRHRGQES